MKEENLEKLFAAARRVGAEGAPSMPAGFAEGVLRRHRQRVEENKAFVRASILSVATALIILGTVLGINFETSNTSADDQESTVEMAYALWDPVGN
ncbi:MAG TPA: hypothetical protein VGF37_09085 [Chthoniobacterales bacterium]|jgi:hypothetical protein